METRRRTKEKLAKIYSKRKESMNCPIHREHVKKMDAKRKKRKRENDILNTEVISRLKKSNFNLRKRINKFKSQVIEISQFDEDNSIIDLEESCENSDTEIDLMADDEFFTKNRVSNILTILNRNPSQFKRTLGVIKEDLDTLFSGHKLIYAQYIQDGELRKGVYSEGSIKDFDQLIITLFFG